MNCVAQGVPFVSDGDPVTPRWRFQSIPMSFGMTRNDTATPVPYGGRVYCTVSRLRTS